MVFHPLQAGLEHNSTSGDEPELVSINEMAKTLIKEDDFVIGILTVDGQPKKEVKVKEKGTVTIGRSGICHIRIRHQAVSKYHAQVEGVNGKAELSLFPVTNVNRMRLNGKKWKVYSSESSIILKDKDVISICDEEIVFHAQPEKASETKVANRNFTPIDPATYFSESSDDDVKHPDHPGSPVQIKVPCQEDCQRPIPKLASEAEAATATQPRIQETFFFNSTYQPSRAPRGSGYAFRSSGLLTRGTRMHTRPKFRDLYTEETDHLAEPVDMEPKMIEGIKKSFPSLCPSKMAPAKIKLVSPAQEDRASVPKPKPAASSTQPKIMRSKAVVKTFVNSSDPSDDDSALLVPLKGMSLRRKQGQRSKARCEDFTQEAAEVIIDGVSDYH